MNILATKFLTWRLPRKSILGMFQMFLLTKGTRTSLITGVWTYLTGERPGTGFSCFLHYNTTMFVAVILTIYTGKEKNVKAQNLQCKIITLNLVKASAYSTSFNTLS